MGDRRIDQGEPDGHEDQHGGELHALGEGTDDQRRGDDRESHLEGDEHRLGEQRCRAGEARWRDTRKERLAHAAEERVEVDDALLHARGVERDAVAINDPQDADQTGNGEALHHHGKNVFRPNHAAVEQREAGNGHEQHQRGGGQHPGRVTAIQHNLVGGHGQAGGNEGQKGS
ncbi:hypothetical protein D9M71_650290 [compost metagenome]